VVLRRIGYAGERRAGAARWCVGGERLLARSGERKERVAAAFWGGKKEKRGALGIYMSGSCG
jgi:hypothetical protein